MSADSNYVKGAKGFIVRNVPRNTDFDIKVIITGTGGRSGTFPLTFTSKSGIIGSITVD